MVTTNTATSGAASTAATSASTKSLNGLTSDFNQFLTLLTTQLKNQDPTSPMETDQFTQQIIGFTQVQESVNTNKNLEQLIAANKAQAVNQAISYVDRFVQAETDTFNLKNKSAILSYDLPSSAKSATVTISDMNGNVVAKLDGSVTKGENKITWDGTGKDNSFENGKFKISVTAKDDAGNDITDIKTYSTELVSQVDLQGDSTVLYIGDIAITMDKIKSVKGYYSDV